MDFTELIKDIIEKIKLFFKNIFNKKKKKNKAKQKGQVDDKQNVKNKKDKNINILYDAQSSKGLKNFTISEEQKELAKLSKKIGEIEKKINESNIKNKEESIEKINNLRVYLNENELTPIKSQKINKALEKAIGKQDEKLEDAINEISDDLSDLIDEKLTTYEKNIVEKAYNEFQEVNYVIVQTLIIDDIIKEIDKLYDDYQKNKYSDYELNDKINNIMTKINKIETNYQKKEVSKEIDRLKKDFYTKKKDKYDLLYSDEIFINLKEQCNRIKISKKALNDTVNEQKKQNQKKKEEITHDNNDLNIIKKKEEIEQNREYNDLIIKRFIDLHVATKLLMQNEAKRSLKERINLIKELLNSYNNFLQGENEKNFNFIRNKEKLEVVKLHNDMNFILAALENGSYTPLEHINIKLDNVAANTMETKFTIETILEKKYGIDAFKNECSKAVDEKLGYIIDKEQEMNKENKKGKGKILIKEYAPEQKDENNKK